MGGVTPKADFQSHHIEGYARAAAEAGKSAHFSAPLISHIEGNLWMGGCIDGVSLGDDFEHVISLYPWEKYQVGDGTERIEITAYDSSEIPDVADAVDTACRMLETGKTLIHCQAGLNRSGLVSALVLMRQGRTAREAIDLLREKRSPLVLCNQAFERHLEGLDRASADAA